MTRFRPRIRKAPVRAHGIMKHYENAAYPPTFGATAQLALQKAGRKRCD